MERLERRWNGGSDRYKHTRVLTNWTVTEAKGPTVQPRLGALQLSAVHNTTEYTVPLNTVCVHLWTHLIDAITYLTVANGTRISHRGSLM